MHVEVEFHSHQRPNCEIAELPIIDRESLLYLIDKAQVLPVKGFRYHQVASVNSIARRRPFRLRQAAAGAQGII
jgi:hypothetical protein